MTAAVEFRRTAASLAACREKIAAMTPQQSLREEASHAGILGVGMAVPEHVLTNDELSRRVDTTDEWIATRTGIRERRVADEATATSDLATSAALKALADAGGTSGAGHLPYRTGVLPVRARSAPRIA